MSGDAVEREDKAARPARADEPRESWLARTMQFLREARAEMNKVTWPTRDELVKATRMILVLSIVLGMMIGLLDLVLQKVLVDGVALLAR